MEDERIFMDKIKLSGMLIAKELTVNENINKLIRMHRSKQLDQDRIQDYVEFHSAWQSLSELYDFLSNDYLRNLEEQEGRQIKKLMEKYQQTEEEMTLQELKKAYSTILKVMSLSKFHDLSITGKSKRDFLAPTTEW